MTSTPDHPPYRVSRETLRGDAWILALIAADVVLGLWSLTWLPDRVPVHFDLSGKADSWGPAWQNALILPGVAIATYALLLVVPLIDPSRANYALFTDTVRFIRGLVVVFLVGFHVVVLLTSIGRGPRMDVMVRVGLPLLFIALGNRFGKLRHNWFFGIRVPWTLASEEVWAKTHRLAGRLWVVGGLLLLPAAALPAGLGMGVFTGVMIVMVLVPVVYSWKIFDEAKRTLPKDAPPGA
jgi:uncharacterized membrane protein